MTPAGNETRRQICLQAMDIQCWYPRLPLPHAAVSRTYAAETAIESPSLMAPESLSGGSAAAAHSAMDLSLQAAQPSVQAAQPSVQAAQPSVQAAQQPMQAARAPEPPQAARIPPPPQAEAQPAPVESEAAVVVAAAEVAEVAAEIPVPHFAFAYLAVSETLAVIAEIPYATRGRLQAPVRGLLSRILEALNITVRSGSTPVIHFQWPLHEGDHLEQNMASARQTVQGFLARQLRERPVPFLLVFSEQWPAYLFPAQFQEAPEGLFAHPQFPAQVLVTRGLHVMLADEAVKRPAWKQLQALKVQIATHAAGGQ